MNSANAQPWSQRLHQQLASTLTSIARLLHSLRAANVLAIDGSASSAITRGHIQVLVLDVALRMTSLSNELMYVARDMSTSLMILPQQEIDDIIATVTDRYGLGHIEQTTGIPPSLIDRFSEVLDWNGDSESSNDYEDSERPH